MQRNLAELPTFDRNSSKLNVVIESPRGSGAKFDYDPDRDLFELSYVMPMGMLFPFDFGFVPSTLADDGDPLDIVVSARRSYLRRMSSGRAPHRSDRSNADPVGKDLP